MRRSGNPDVPETGEIGGKYLTDIAGQPRAREGIFKTAVESRAARGLGAGSMKYYNLHQFSVQVTPAPRFHAPSPLNDVDLRLIW